MKPDKPKMLLEKEERELKCPRRRRDRSMRSDVSRDDKKRRDLSWHWNMKNRKGKKKKRNTWQDIKRFQDKFAKHKQAKQTAATCRS